MTQQTADIIEAPYAFVLGRDAYPKSFKNSGSFGIQETEKRRKMGPILRNHLSLRCSHCTNAAQQRCTNCKVAHYCNTECQTKDWPFHRFECESFLRAANCDELTYLNDLFARLIGRLVGRQLREANVSSDDAQQADQKSKTWYGLESRSIADLNPFLEPYEQGLDPEAEKQFECARENYWHLFRYTALGRMNDADWRLLFLRVYRNAFRVFDYDPLYGEIEIGLALYPNASRFGHSCAPDLLAGFEGPNLKLRRVDPRSTKSLAQCTLDYIPLQTKLFDHHALSFIDERKDWLRWLRFLDCKCAFCAGVGVERDTVMRYSLKDPCPSCMDGVMCVEKKGENRWCTACGHVEVQFDYTKRAINAVRALDKLVGCGLDGVSLPEIAQEFLNTVIKSEQYLHPIQNVYLIQAYEDIFSRYRTLIEDGSFQDYAKAIASAEKLLKGYEFYLTPMTSFRVPLLLCQMGECYRMNRQYMEAAIKYKQAAQGWALRYGKEHKCIKAIQNLMIALNAERLATA